MFKALFKKRKDYSVEINKAREWIMQADAIVVSIGSDLSASGGLDMAKPYLVKEYFTSYYHMGYKSLNELQDMYSQITDENAKAYWGYWARYIKYIAYEREVGNGYRDLLRLIRNKAYFICTIPIDSQVQKAGFKLENILALHGDSRWLKCSKSCCDKLYESKDLLEAMIKSMNGNLEIAGNKVPRCPHCGNYLIPNIKLGNQAVQSVCNVEDKSEQGYINFLKRHSKEKIVFVELGITQSQTQDLEVLSEKIIDQNIESKWIRVNKKEVKVSNKLSEEMVSIEMDLEEAIAQVASGIVSL